MSVRISVVIPAFNEAQYLPRLLDTLAVARQRYTAGSDAVEIIVADNGSTDRTAEIAATHGCTVVPVVPRVIGAVRNGGARAARGVIVAFIDADTQVHQDTFNAIDECLATGRRIGGVSGVVPERHSRGIDVTWTVLHAMGRLGGMEAAPGAAMLPTGVVCCRKDDWAAVGGYSERWLFCEDVRFLLELQRLGRKDGRTLGWLRDAPAIFCTRKFDAYGDWHYLTFPLKLAGAIFWRGPIRRFAQEYWYGEQRVPTDDRR